MDLPSIEGISLDFVVIAVVVGAAVFIGELGESDNAVVRLLLALRENVLKAYPKISATCVAVIHIGFALLCRGGEVVTQDFVTAGFAWLISLAIFSELK